VLSRSELVTGKSTGKNQHHARSQPLNECAESQREKIQVSQRHARHQVIRIRNRRNPREDQQGEDGVNLRFGGDVSTRSCTVVR
jgi:hypothetical protein